MSTDEKTAPVFKKDVVSGKKTVSFSMGFLINASLVSASAISHIMDSVGISQKESIKAVLRSGRRII